MAFERIKQWFGRSAASAEDAVEGRSPVAMPPAGADPNGTEDSERETSTNAQMEGASDDPWPGNT
jgi:hypothetical protein